jgi:PAS domain S-box-containing protein
VSGELVTDPPLPRPRAEFGRSFGSLVTTVNALLRAISRPFRPAGDDLLRSMIDAVSVEVLSFDANRRLIALNQAVRDGNTWTDASTWIGLSFEEILTLSIAHHRSRDPGRDWDAWMAARKAQFDSFGIEDVHRPNGDWRRVHVIPGNNGGRLIVRHDITELKEREAALAASEHRYSDLVESLPDVILSIDGRGRIEFVSQIATDVLGCRPEELQGRALRTLVCEGDRPRLGQMFERVLAGGAAETAICEVVRRGDDARRLMQITLKRRSNAGNPQEPVVGAIVRDVHEQQTLVLKRELEMEQLQSMFQSNGAYFLMLDRDERIIMMNQALRDLRGFGDEVVGQHYRSSSHAALGHDVIERWRDATGGERLEPFEYESTTADATGRPHIIKVTATPVQDRSGLLRYILLVGVDDTERRQAEIRLFDASRLANLGEMASGIAHEINQPLAVIRLAADSLLEELELPDADPEALNAFMREKLDRIAAQTERASRIIRELRGVARKPTNAEQPFDVADCARVGDDLLHEQLRSARIELTLDVGEGQGPQVIGEASRLQQVIINLVLNARDAILERSDASTVGTLGTIALRLGTDLAAREAVLTIEDDGPGIPDAVLPRLFQPFFTTKPAGKGTGLGLSISYDIVRRMGGDIRADNRPEGGARFRITLPMVRADLLALMRDPPDRDLKNALSV